jgi:protein-L-isoaspartate(D-aspartate) O-methyltransferase
MRMRCGAGAALVAACISILAGAGCASGEAEYAARRDAMVASQIALRGVTDERVLDAMRAVPRHRFVPAALRGAAYADRPLPIGEGQTISQPYIVALMTESLGSRAHGKVLEIGTGSGYQAAVLAEIADTVYSIEIIPALAARARAILDTLGYRNIHIRAGDGYFGWPEAAPFDAVIVTAAAPRIPEPLVSQLRAGGRIIIPIGDALQELELYEKRADGLKLISRMPVRFVPMKGTIRE